MKLFGSSVITATRRSCACKESVVGDSPTCRAASVTSSFVKRALGDRAALFAPEVKLARDAWTRFVRTASNVICILFSAMPAKATGAIAVAPLPKYPLVQHVTPHCAMTAIKEDPRSAALAMNVSASSAVRTVLNAVIFTARRAISGGTNALLAQMTGNLMRRLLGTSFIMREPPLAPEALVITPAAPPLPPPFPPSPPRHVHNEQFLSPS